MSCRRSVIFLSALVLTAGTARTREPQIEQARQFGAVSPGLAPSVEKVEPLFLDASSSGDDDSFGVQQMLREKERLRPFRVFADISAFVTNNVALTRKDALSDSFLVGIFGFEYRRPLSHGFQLETSLQAATFRYDKFRQFDFNSVDAGFGASYHATKLGGIDFSARYNFNELVSTKGDEAFFKNHTITLGVQKVVAFSQAHYGFLGVAGQVGFADPKVSERSEFSEFVGYHLQATRNLEGMLLYRYTTFVYSMGERTDRYQTLSLGLCYRFTALFSVSATSYVGWNRSSQGTFDYNVANVGGGLALRLQF